MKFNKIICGLTVALLMLTLVACGNAGQASYPHKAITMIVPYSAGGTTDLVGRKLAQELGTILGQPITVINQAGASGAVGCKTVLDAPADGYTLLFMADSLGTQRVMSLSQMSYDDFAPIMVTVNDPKVIVVNKNSPYNTINELVQDMRERPGKVKMSYTGPGGSGHVQSLVYQKSGLQAALTAYTGGNECIVAVLGNQVDFTNANFSTITGYLQSGELKLLAVSGTNRLAAYPEVPTLDEQLPDIREYLDIPFTPLSLLVNKDVPQDIQVALTEAANKAVATESWKQYVTDNCLEELYIDYPTADKAQEFYKNWESVVSWLIYDAGAAKLSPEQFDIARPRQ